MFTVKEVLQVLTGARVKGQGSCLKGISTDTRAIGPGELFIPLTGDKFDGREFIDAALKKGAFALETNNGLKSLQKLAAYHRSKFNIPVIGITGSAGKTTTKDMLASILSQSMPTLKNKENFNNEIGVPLTLLKLNKKHKAAVIEMGMRGKGEIKLLAGIARPTIAIVTNTGEAHLKFLKTKKNIAKAKAEIFSFLKKEDWAVINRDDEFFEYFLKQGIKGSRDRGIKIMSFGIYHQADIKPADIKGTTLPVPGEHNKYNALAAIAAAKILGISKKSIKKGLENCKLSSKRMEIIRRKDGVTIINDTYNASPQSTAAALKVLAKMPGKRKIAVLGDMLELGKAAKPAHASIGRLARGLGIDQFFSVGKLSKAIKADAHFTGNISAVRELKPSLRFGDVVLVKGSRGMRMEEISLALREK